jgi:hypothetical protein
MHVGEMLVGEKTCRHIVDNLVNKMGLTIFPPSHYLF